MMHYENIVVTLCDSNKKALREYSAERILNGRRSTVNLPFDTEYQILIKNNQGINIRLDIDIDGTNVTNDGLVIRPYQTTHLERFLNSKNKFKFVPLSNSGVSDPTSSQNGIITVKAFMEKQIVKKYIAPRQPIMRSLTKGTVYGAGGSCCRGSATDTDWKGSLPVSYSCEYSSMPLGASNDMAGYNCCVNTSMNMEPTSSAGATVEGSRSDQEFTTVNWAGDDPMIGPFSFVFQLLGMNNQENKEWQDYLRLKEKFGAV